MYIRFQMLPYFALFKLFLEAGRLPFCYVHLLGCVSGLFYVLRTFRYAHLKGRCWLLIVCYV